MSKIFLDVLNLSIASSWLILAVILFRGIFGKAPKWMRCILWGLVAIRLVIPFDVKSALSLIPSARTIPEDIEYAAVPNVDTGIPMINTVVNPVMEQSFTPEPSASANPLQIIIPICSIVWFLGIGILLIYALASFLLLKKKVAASVWMKENIYECDEVKSPFILGIVRPRIYMPSEICHKRVMVQDENTCENSVMDCVLQHERTHIRRGDHIWKILGFLILSIHWFNLLCWISYILFCRDIELACDEKATKDMDDASRADYCQALLDCSNHRRWIAACPVAFGEVDVKNRIKSVLNYKKPTFWIMVVSGLVCIIIAVCFLTNPKAEEENSYDLEEMTEIDSTEDAEAAWDAFLNYHTPYSMKEDMLEFRNISYGDFLKETNSEAAFYHSTRYIAPVPRSNVFAVFEGVYDEDEAQAKLLEESGISRLQGALEDFVYMDEDELSVADFAKKTNTFTYTYLEGAGTAYYVSDEYVRFVLDANQNGSPDTFLEVAVSKDKDTVGKNSTTWMLWVEENSVSEGKTWYANEYTGYMDEFENYSFRESYENLDLDRDGLIDRVYREYTEDDRCNIELRFGDGSALLIENQYDNVYPYFYALPNEAGKVLVAYYGSYPGAVGEVVNYDMAFYEKNGNDFVLSKVPFIKNIYDENSFPQYMNVTVSQVDEKNYIVGYSCEQLPDFYEEVQMTEEAYTYAGMESVFSSWGTETEFGDTRFYTIQTSATDPYVIECHAHIIYHCDDELMVALKYIDDEWKLVDYGMVDRYTGVPLSQENAKASNLQAASMPEKTASQINYEDLPIDSYERYPSALDEGKTVTLLCGSPGMGMMNKYLFWSSGNLPYDLSVNFENEVYTEGLDITLLIHNYPQDALFVSEDIGFIGTNYHGYDEYLYRTTTGGKTWESIQIPQAEQEEHRYLSVYDLEYKDETLTVYLNVVSDQKILDGCYISTDYGENWQCVYLH